MASSATLPRKRSRDDANHSDASGGITPRSPHEPHPLQQALAAQWREGTFCDIVVQAEGKKVCVLDVTR